MDLLNAPLMNELCPENLMKLRVWRVLPLPESPHPVCIEPKLSRAFQGLNAFAPPGQASCGLQSFFCFRPSLVDAFVGY